MIGPRRLRVFRAFLDYDDVGLFAATTPGAARYRAFMRVSDYAPHVRITEVRLKREKKLDYLASGKEGLVSFYP